MNSVEGISKFASKRAEFRLVNGEYKIVERLSEVRGVRREELDVNLTLLQRFEHFVIAVYAEIVTKEEAVVQGGPIPIMIERFS